MLELRDHQKETLLAWRDSEETRGLLMHATGSGKTILSLLMLRVRGVTECTVVGVPITKDSWLKQAGEFGMTIEFVSHEKFRQKTFEPKYQNIIVDEIHKVSSLKGKVGAKKMLSVSRKVNCIIGASATPRYNSGDRLYMVGKTLWPQLDMWKGGYPMFLHKYCVTKPNYFSMLPEFVRFKTSEEDMFRSLPFVSILQEDDLDITDVVLKIPNTDQMKRLNRINMVGDQLMTSVMKKTIVNNLLNYGYVNERTLLPDSLRPTIVTKIKELSKGKTMLFAKSLVIVDLLSKELTNSAVITGETKKTDRFKLLDKFKTDEDCQYLIGTTAIATGLDGLDRVCDTLIIVEDIADATLRSQLTGRIKDRSGEKNNDNKNVYRLKFERSDHV